MSQYLQVITTVETEEDAHRVAEALVGERLAACVQIGGPISSTYWWKGEVCRGAEWQCVLKTRADLMPSVKAALGRVHPYEVPEILAFPVVDGGEAYLAWMDTELRAAPRNTKGPTANGDGPFVS